MQVSIIKNLGTVYMYLFRIYGCVLCMSDVMYRDCE